MIKFSGLANDQRPDIVRFAQEGVDEYLKKGKITAADVEYLKKIVEEDVYGLPAELIMGFTNRTLAGAVLYTALHHAKLWYNLKDVASSVHTDPKNMRRLLFALRRV